MSHSTIITASSIAVVSDISVLQGQSVTKGQTVLTLHIMGTDLPVVASHTGRVKRVWVKVDDEVEVEQKLLEIVDESQMAVTEATETQVMSNTDKALSEFEKRKASTLDEVRSTQLAKRQAQGFRSARQNLAQICDVQQFMEYGQFAVAAQRQRRDYQQLKTATAADGIITGVGEINRPQGASASTQAYKTAIVINDYSVLAGTQGFFHHRLSCLPKAEVAGQEILISLSLIRGCSVRRFPVGQR